MHHQQLFFCWGSFVIITQFIQQFNKFEPEILKAKVQLLISVLVTLKMKKAVFFDNFFEMAPYILIIFVISKKKLIKQMFELTLIECPIICKKHDKMIITKTR